ncbi:FAD-dependent oxidoreductase [Acuticoccus sp. M5D2P5]|uniref:NAD(P)/FAD-dependent oxidoreductase n=1 Tax=Acuticoccus kalidii TaxID=2910977 RepID=UPI001F1B03F7|nr:FAD-dependent oxidoreductase [Acuticoccus kalidii]MCF3933000.1 FAD-dependent oxidoreductase [Acuticoccus kalidii]
MPERVVIIGAGHAGFQAAASLRSEGFEGEIVLLSPEDGLPYQRPPLSKAYMMGKTTRENLAFRPDAFFETGRIERRKAHAHEIDRTNRRVLTDDGAVPYDHLILAVGAHGRALPVPGADLDGVFMLRTLEDADAIGAHLGNAKNAVVVGAGFIGLEFAAVARAAGLSVHVLELADRPMARAISPEMSALFRAAHEGWGVRLDLGQGLAGLVGENGRVVAVETTEGRRIPADIVVVGIGVLPNTGLASEAGLAIENGIRVDETLLTSDPAISAIGDCASFPEPRTGAIVRLESVQNATDHARTVAARLMGKPAPYHAVPWFWSDQGDLKLQMAGLSTGYDTAILTGEEGDPGRSVLCFAGDRLVSVESVNKGGDHMSARRILGGAGPLPTPDEAAARDFDLKAWVLARR